MLFSQLSLPALTLLRLWALAMECAMIFEVTQIWRLKASAWAKGFGSAQLVCAHLLVQLMLGSEGRRTRCESSPVLPVVLGLLTLMGLLGMTRSLLARRMRRHVGPMSIREAANALPTGLCYYDADGLILLQNTAMADIARQLLGRHLSSGMLFWREICALADCPEDAVAVLKLPDGAACQFRRRQIAVDGRPISEITAVDVTALDRANTELRERNARLERVNARLRSYGAELSDVIRSREILAARTAVHDELGQTLLATRYCVEHPGGMNAQGVLEMWSRLTGLLLRDAEVDEDAESDLFGDLIDVAGSIGVRVEIEGELPGEEPAYTLLARGLHTCITNVRKHAGGDLLRLRVRREEGWTVARYTNNGRPPEGEIRETGGLLSLRQLVEQAGGSMAVRGGGPFELTLRIPPG